MDLSSSSTNIVETLVGEDDYYSIPFVVVDEVEKEQDSSDDNNVELIEYERAYQPPTPPISTSSSSHSETPSFFDHGPQKNWKVVNDDCAESGSPRLRLVCEKASNVSVVESEQKTTTKQDQPVSTPARQCVVCLVTKVKTEDLYSGNYVRQEIYTLLEHLDVPLRGNGTDTGLCYDCMGQLQQWHRFYTTRQKFLNQNPPKELHKLVFPPPPVERKQTYSSSLSLETRRKFIEVKEIYDKSKFRHYVVRDWNERDLEFLCYQICNNPLSSPCLIELELYFMDKKKLLQMFCSICMQHVTGGKHGYECHMSEEHKQQPIFYPCDICGSLYPDKENAIIDDYFTHWLKHFYFFSCDDCFGITFPTMCNLLQHKEACHKKQTTCFQQKYDPPIVFFEPKPIPQLDDEDGDDEDMDYDSQNFKYNVEKKKSGDTKKQYVKCDVWGCGERLQRPFIRLHKLQKHGVSQSKNAKQINNGNINTTTISAHSAIDADNVIKSPTITSKSTKNATNNIKIYKFKCTVCTEKFIRPDQVLDHVNFYHLHQRNYVCRVCNKAFSRLCYMRSHEEVSHKKGINKGTINKLSMKNASRQRKASSSTSTESLSQPEIDAQSQGESILPANETSNNEDPWQFIQRLDIGVAK